jgi:NurA-like 5'-3' nuclease
MPTNPELECHVSVTANRTCRMQLVHMASLKIYKTHVNRSDDKIMLDTVHCLKYIQYIIHGTPICRKPHIFQTEILALLDSWVTNTVFRNAVHKNIASPYILLQT